MIEAASEPIPSPLLAAIVAAAPANENCNINADLTKKDDESTRKVVVLLPSRLEVSLLG
jgi:hypothetical protein